MHPRSTHVALALALVLGVATRAEARDVSVRVSGCPGAEGAVAGALALELGAGWRMVAEDLDAEAGTALRVEVDIARCDAEAWSARVLDGSGALLRGPAELAMAGFPASGRARIAALWIAEWLATLESASEVETEPEVETEAEAQVESVEAEEPAATRDVEPAPRAAEEPPLRVRLIGLASIRQVPDTPATLGGLELGLQIARTGTVGLGAEIGAGIEHGAQWRYDMLVVRGTLSAFVLLGGSDWLEIDVGARATLEELVSYTRGAARERLSGTLHGSLGGFVRTLVFVLPATLAIAVDLELGSALAPVSYYVDQPPGYELPDDYDDLLDGFYFSARAGIVWQ